MILGRYCSIRQIYLFSLGLTLVFSGCTPKEPTKISSTSETALISSTPDVISPDIVAISPSVGEGDVDPNSVITITFSEPMDISSLNNSTFLVTSNDGNKSTNVAGSISFAGLSAIFTPTEVMEYETQYRVSIYGGITDLAGNKISSETFWSFWILTEAREKALDVEREIFETIPFTILSFQSTFFGEPSDTASFLMDFDSDGDLDLIVGQNLWPPEPSQLSAFRNDGNGVLTDATSEVFEEGIIVENPRHWVIADFNGDGRDDVFIADTGFDSVGVGGQNIGGQSLLLMQNEAGQLVNETSERIPAILAFTHNVCAADIDNDGDVDIYMGNRPRSSIQIGPRFYINDGNGFFESDRRRVPGLIAAQGDFEPTVDYGTCAFIDADNDGDLDLFLGGNSDNSNRDTLLLNNGAGNFSYAPSNSLPRRNERFDDEVGTGIADFNQDGWPDIVIAGQEFVGEDPNRLFTFPDLQLFMNNGDGTFRDESGMIATNWDSLVHPGMENDQQNIDWPVIVDFNMDGWPDIYTVNYQLEPVLFENHNGEEFVIAETLGSYMQTVERQDFVYFELSDYAIIRAGPDSGRIRLPTFALIGDLDGDGDQDYVLIYTDSETHFVLLRK